MALAYTIDDIIVDEYHVDLIQQMVTVQYREVSGGETIKRGIAYFHATLPAEPTAQDFLLVPAKAAELVSLRNDAETAIANRLGV